jgi:hypothetical protein
MGEGFDWPTRNEGADISRIIPLISKSFFSSGYASVQARRFHSIKKGFRIRVGLDNESTLLRMCAEASCQNLATWRSLTGFGYQEEASVMAF